MSPRWLALAFLTLWTAAAQEIRVVSEFQIVDPFDQCVGRPADAPDPREILSPASPRGGFLSFRIVVDPGPRVNGVLRDGYELHVGVNPDDVVAVALYREVFAEKNGHWLPVSLEEAKPVYVVQRGTRDPIPDQKVHTYWMDVYVKPNAKVQRMKVQPEILVRNRWIEYPMELRVLRGVFPLINYQKEVDPLREENRWSSLAKVMSVPDSSPAEALDETLISPELLLRRNILQDALYLKKLKRTAREALLQRLGAPTPEALLRKLRENPDPEYYLTFRDALIGAREPE